MAISTNMKTESNKTTSKTNYKKIETQLKYENDFVTNLFNSLPIPASAQKGKDITQLFDISISNNFLDEQPAETETRKKPNGLSTQNGSTRAKSLVELQNRLKAITGKDRLSYKEKLLKKGIKNKIKKKNKKDERSLKQKLIKLEREKTNNQIKPDPDEATSSKPRQPVFNSEAKMVFSKIDFSGLGNKHEKRTEKDPKKILQNLEKQKEKIKELEMGGNKDKAVEIKEKVAWKNALAKAEGEKVKDDPILLKKSIKKREQLKKTSQKKWKVREDGVKKAQDERQRKRNDNIAKRKKEKKTTKLKKAVKKGRIIPGF